MEEKTRVVLLGAGDLACPLLRALHGSDRVELAGVVVQPDRPGGRGKKLLPCRVKCVAAELGIEPMESAAVSSEKMVECIAGLKPDVVVVADFGQILKEPLLAVPRWGTLNVHPSLLPKYRGASPIQWTLANGDAETGVCVLFVTPALDAGDILECYRTPVLPDETAPELEARLAEKGAELLLKALESLRLGTAHPVPQDPAGVVVVQKLKKEEGRIDWAASAGTIVNRWRGFTPWPGLYTTVPDGSLLKVHRVRAEEASTGAEPGTVLSCDGEGPLVACGGGGAVRLLEVQPAGRNRMDGAAYCRGRALREGDRLGG